jgi:hypothetical protein
MAESTARDPLDVSPQPIPLPQTGALTPPDEEIDSLATPPDMAKTIAEHQIAAGQVNHGDARDWAENTVAGVQAALAGFGAAGKVNPGSGALAGVGAAASQAQENQQKQKQQAFANKMAQQKQMTEQQVAQAQIAHLNAEQHNLERLSRDADEEHMQKMLAFDQTAAEPFIEAGTRSMGEHLTSDDLQRMLKPGASGKSEINGHKVLVFRDGLAPMIGRDGKPALDSTTGQPVMRPTYRLFEADGPGVKFDDEQVKLISENTPYKPKPGVEVDPVSAYTILTQAKKNQAVNLNIQKVQAEIGKEEAETGKAKEETTDKQEQRQLEQKAAKIFSPYLAQANGDPWRAIQLMGKDPSARGQIGVIEQAYGPGHIEEWHQKQEEIGIKAEELRQKKLNDVKVWGDPDAPTTQAFRASLSASQLSAIEMVRQGRAPIENAGYILSRNPGFVEAMERLYPGEVDFSKVSAYKAATKDFTSGKDADQLQAGSIALDHLQQLRAINDRNPIEVHVPGSKPYKDYQNLLDTVGPELGRFYENTTIPGIQSYRESLTGLNRDTAINRQISSMAVRMKTYDDKWKGAAPSPAYEAKMPGDYAVARSKMATMDPEYRRSLAGTAGGVSTRPAGATMLVPGSDGKMHWSDGKQDLGVQ